MTRPRLKLQRESQGYYCGIPKIGDRVFGQGNKRNINETSSDSPFYICKTDQIWKKNK